MNNRQKSIIQVNKEFLVMLYDTLLKHRSMKITNFGMFKLVRTKGIKGSYNLHSRKTMDVPPFTRISFRPSAALRRVIKKAKV